MKHLFLLRHAKSVRADEDLDDHDRPLGSRGQAQLVPLAKALTQSGALDGDIFCSDARRTRETLEGAVPELMDQVQVRPELYTFDYRKLIHWLKALDGSGNKRVTLVGHNPALLELAGWLLRHPPAHLPTAGLIHIRLPIKHWEQLTKHAGKLEAFLTPRHYSYTHFASGLNKPPGGNSSRKIPQALLRQYQLIRHLEPGVIVGLDDEFTHQYRIAIRRSRAIAEAVRDVTGNRLLDRPVRQLKQNAGATSRLRDLHVFLQDLPGLCQRALVLRSTLEDYFTLAARAEHKRLCKRLTGKRYRHSMEEWHDLIDSGKFRKLAGSLTSSHIRQSVQQRIDRFNKRAMALDAHAPDRDLHWLRKQLKRIRYLMELDKATWKTALTELKQRQEVYGQFQDLHVQMELIREFRSSGATGIPRSLQTLEQRLEQRKAGIREQILALGALSPEPDSTRG